MARDWIALESIFIPLAQWARGLSSRRLVVFGTFPSLEAAFTPDDLPLAFILRRDSHRRRTGNGKRHMRPVRVARGIGRQHGVYVTPPRAYVRSALRANADRSGGDRAA